MHLIHEVPYRTDDDLHYHMVVEIPAGSTEKWHATPESGQLEWEMRDGQPRVIRFLSYPFNYGFIPQTVIPQDHGGDGDALDALLIAPAASRGSIHPVRVIGAMQFTDRGERDAKLVCLPVNETFSDVTDIPDLLMHYPGMLEIIRFWFEGYKGIGQSQTFGGYQTSQDARQSIETAYQFWCKTLQAD